RDQLHHGGDGGPDAGAGQERGGAGGQRGPDELIHPADEHGAGAHRAERGAAAHVGGVGDGDDQRDDRDGGLHRHPGAPGRGDEPPLGGGGPQRGRAAARLHRGHRRAVAGDLQDRAGDRGHRRPDQPAGAQRHDRGGARRRGGQGLRRGGRRGAAAGGTLGGRDPGDRRGDRHGPEGDPGGGGADGAGDLGDR